MIESIDKYMFRQALFNQIIKSEVCMNRMNLIFSGGRTKNRAA